MCTQMASSKVITSRSPPNPDPPRKPSPSPLNLHSDHTQGFDSMNIEDIIMNIYSDYESVALDDSGGGGGVRNGEPAMTLEDFLAKAGAVNEEDVRVPTGVTMASAAVAFGMETAMMNPARGVPAVQFASELCMGYGVDFGNGMVRVSGGVRGKRRAAVEAAPLDKATQQKQRRMIKNRESAARSRERKQAYTMELEALVTQLEEDNARLLTEEAQLNKERYKKLMEKLIPVVEKQRAPRVLKRVHSMEW